MSNLWNSFLSSNRIDNISGNKTDNSTGSRTDFERDYHRILFSYSFRRLQGKTQVFPKPVNDHVHNRLTHSLEVASVGRSLGKLVGAKILEKNSDLDKKFHSSDFGDIVSAACLAHDLGNPPFGHAGEDAIGRWFQTHRDCLKNAELAEDEIKDLETFEGNAQGFRVVSRLSGYGTSHGGMRLTCATLAAFSKYPQSSIYKGDNSSVARKKYSFLSSEKEIFKSIAKELNLKPTENDYQWNRHPLAFLVEAADDICYSIMDAEDGYLLSRFSQPEIKDMFSPIIGDNQDLLGNASKTEQVNQMRAIAINNLAEETVEAFVKNEEKIVSGEFNKSIIDIIPSSNHIENIKSITRERCYNAPEVLEILVAGYTIIGNLLDIFIPAILAKKPTIHEKRSLLLLPRPKAKSETDYEKILSVTDYISGMTDEFAISLYRRLTGIELPRM